MADSKRSLRAQVAAAMLAAPAELSTSSLGRLRYGGAPRVLLAPCPDHHLG